MSPMHRSNRENVNTSPASFDAILGSKRLLNSRWGMYQMKFGTLKKND